MARRGNPPEFRRRVVDLVEGGRKVSEVAAELLGQTAVQAGHGDSAPAEVRIRSAAAPRSRSWGRSAMPGAGGGLTGALAAISAGPPGAAAAGRPAPG
jgi:hypothetical protein